MARLRRVAEVDRPELVLTVDGQVIQALLGDTVLTAVMTNGGHLRISEFGDGERAGFCLMGACQDCWMWTEAGDHIRACSTPAEAGMRLRTTIPDTLWRMSA
jgi:D-hydroxyproline dehydrogenase subunit gamma